MPSDKSNQIQHLTSVDIDISGIVESLNKAREEIEKSSLEDGKVWATNFTIF